MLVFVKVEVALGLLIFLPQNAVRRSELGHDQAASAQVADEASEDGVRHPGHRREDRRGGNRDIADCKTGRDWLQGPRSNDPWRCQPTCRSARATRIVPKLLHRLILPAATKRSPRRSGGSIPLVYPRESVKIRGESYFFAGSAFAYLRRKRSTRPAVSMSFCLPVKNGWQFEQISTPMSPLWVERVINVLPHAQCTRTSLYAG